MRAPSALIGCMFLAGCMINSPQPVPRHVPTPAPAAGTTLPRGPASADAVDSGPQAAVDREALKALPDLIARSEPRVAAGNFSPYVVLGQTYEVLNQADDYAEEGLASWYGTKFHGRATSNGEAFDMYTLSAAHKTLPIPSYVRVTNLNNGLATVLRVNDRGPFHDDRLIDLSYAAAVKLGFDLNGTAPVRVEMLAAPYGTVVPRTRLARNAVRDDTQTITPAARSRTAAAGGAAVSAASSTAAAVSTASAVATSTESVANNFYLQAGAFRSREAAERMMKLLRELLGRRVSVVLESGQDSIHRVRIGPLLSLAEASSVQNKLIEANQGTALIVRG